MLQKAIEKIPVDTDTIVLEKGDIFSLGHFENYFDIAVCIRFTNWISSEDLRKALFELSRITKGKIIVYIPTYTGIKEFNLLCLKDLTRLILQLKLRFYRKRKKSEQVIHEKSKIYDFFDQLDIEIEKVFCIDPAGGRNWMRGYERNIYLLSKIDTAKGKGA